MSPGKRKPLKKPKKNAGKVLVDKNQTLCGKKGRFMSGTASLNIIMNKDAESLNESLCLEETAVSSENLATQTGKNVQVSMSELPSTPSLRLYREDLVLSRKLSSSFNQGTDYFAKLSDEIILHIFRMLPKPLLVTCAEVCKRFRRLSYDESLWKRYDFGRRVVKPNVLAILLRRGVTVLRLFMSNIKSPVFTDAEFLSPVGHRYCDLQYLDMSMVTISPSGLERALYVCKHLKKLSIEHCVLNEDCLRNIAQNSEMEVLNMAMCRGLTPLGLREICINCMNLKEWNLGWADLTKECMAAFLPVLPHSLKRFNISGHRDSFDDEALITVIERCEKLIELDISDSTLITETSFIVLLTKASKLQHLHCSRSYNIPLDDIRLLKEKINFKKLEIFGTLTEIGLASLREHMPDILINQNIFTTIARPTTGLRRTSIWGLRVRDFSA